MLTQRWIAPAILVVGLVGCNNSADNPPAAAINASNASTPVAAPGGPGANPSAVARDDGPAAAVYEWLDAVQKGNDAKATAMLTALARERSGNVGPPASDTAKFEVGEAQYLGEDGARVASLWTDLDENGEPQTDQMLWVLRKEAEGWRIAGVAATIFDGEPPLLLNFEDPEEMAKKQQWAREEVQRRYEASHGQAQGTGTDAAIRR